MEYRIALDEMKRNYNVQKGRHDEIISQITKLNNDIDNITQNSSAKEVVRILLQKTAESARIKAKERLENIVTNALRYIFGENFYFIIELGSHGDKPIAEFYVATEQNGVLVKNKPQDSRGGGIVDIVSLALRMAFLELHQNPRINGPIILDEPGKHVDEESAVHLAMFVKEMSTFFNRQIIMVTHQPLLADIADRAFRVELRQHSSHVFRLGFDA